MSAIDIRTTRFDNPVARTLIKAAMADLGVRYGGSGDETPVDPSEFEPPAGCFLVAWVDGVPAGCGGWRTLVEDDAAAEIKRMYTAPDWRGRGVATALLRAIESSARDAGKKRTVLETGDRQPEAIALYRKLGYERVPNFGFYKDYPGCLCFGRVL